MNRIITKGDLYPNDTPLSCQIPHTLNLKTRFAWPKAKVIMVTLQKPYELATMTMNADL